MKLYYEILLKEYEKCLNHKKEYCLYGLHLKYDIMNDAILCAYQYIEKYFYNDKKLIKYAKTKLKL